MNSIHEATTLRWYLQAGIDDGDREVMLHCLKAALAILDGAERDCFDHDRETDKHRWVRLIPDPEVSA